MDIVLDTNQGARIKIIGVGGGGGNAVQNMINSNLEGVSFICANTDIQDLSRSSAIQLQIGKETTKGLGCGAKPEVGRKSAEESIDEIEKALNDTDMVFITAGMGGGTGTGAAPVIAKAAKEKNILTIGVVTKPFALEGARRMEHALKGIEELRKQVDSLVVIPNERLRSIGPKAAKFSEMFKKADDVLYDAVRGITDLITKPGLINLDFADLRSVMENKGMALMGEGRASGETRALDAAKTAISNPLLEDLSITGCKALLVNITTNGDLGMDEWYEAGEFIRNAARGQNGEDPEIFLGMSIDESCGDEIRITVVATGIETPSEVQEQANAKIPASQQAATGPRNHNPRDILSQWENIDGPSPAVPGTADSKTAAKSESDEFTFEEDDTPAFFRRRKR
ncbi:MAG: cell division protein FtsZ [Mailhella sp.]|nr:cell division protein FtsZ [Mailhella sp.]